MNATARNNPSSPEVHVALQLAFSDHTAQYLHTLRLECSPGDSTFPAAIIITPVGPNGVDVTASTAEVVLAIPRDQLLSAQGRLFVRLFAANSVGVSYGNSSLVQLTDGKCLISLALRE